MDLLKLVLRRLLAQRSLTVATVVALAFAIGVLVAAPVYADGAERALVFAYMERANPLSKDVQIQLLTPPHFNGTQTMRQIRAAMAPLPLSRIVTQAESGVTKVSGAHGSALAPLAYRDGLLSEVPLERGRDPRTADEVLLPQALAAAVGAGPGSRITLSYKTTTQVKVAGIYSPAAIGDPRISSEGRLLAQRGGVAGSLPMLTSGQGFEHITTELGQDNGIHMEWDAELDFAGLTVHDLGALAVRSQAAATTILRSVGGTVIDRMGSLIPGARRAAAQGLAPTYLVALVVALVGLGVVIGVASMKLGRQSFELAVLKTRGAGTLELMAMQSTESTAAAVLALPLALGLGVALALLARAAHGPGLAGAQFPVHLVPSAVMVGIAGCVIGALALSTVSLPYVRRNVIEERRAASRQGRPVWLRAPVELPLLALGLIALAELRQRGIGGVHGALDPLVLVAPTLLMLGAGILAVRLLVHWFGRALRLADETGSASVYFAARRLARSSADMSLALLLVLSLGLFAFASSLRTTVLTRNRDVARQEVGADWSLVVGTPGSASLAAERLPPHTTLAFYGSTAASSDSQLVPAPAIGIDPSTYAGGAWWQPQDADRPLSGLVRALTPPPIGAPLPPAVSSMQIEVTASRVAGLRLWTVLEYPTRGVVGRDLGPLRSGTERYETAVSGARRLLSIVLVAPFPVPPSLLQAGDLPVMFQRLTVSGSFGSRSVDMSGWRGLQTGAATVRVVSLGGGGVRATVTAVGGGPIGGVAPPAPPVPILVGGVRNSLPRQASLQIGHLHLQTRIAGTVRSFPTTEPGLPFIILPVQAVSNGFAQILQPPNGGVFAVLGMGRHDPTGSVRGVGLHVVRTFATARVEGLLASSQQNLAIGMEFAAGVAGVLLAVLVLSLALYFGGQRRDYEFSSLRAVGGRARHAGIALAVEYGLVLAASMAIGFALGAGLLSLVVSLVTPPETTTAAIPRLVVDWRGLLIAAAIAVGAGGLALALAVRHTRPLSAAAVLRGEPE